MNMEMRKDTTWIFKDIMKARLSIVDSHSSWQQALMADKFKMGKVYKELMKDYDYVDWYVIFAGNIARPRALLYLWVACRDGKLTQTRGAHHTRT